jgi:transcriptional regulator with XRE-family HTH domain
MPLLQNFADNLRDAMEERGITGAELARLSGLHFVTISRILNGKLCPTLETCEKLANAAGMRPDTAFLEPLKKNR